MIFWIIFLLLAAIFGIIFLPYKFHVRGVIDHYPTSFSFNGSALLGGKKMGITLILVPDINLGIGPYENPWFHIPLKKKKFKWTYDETGTYIKKYFHKVTGEIGKKITSSMIKSIHLESVSLIGKLGLSNPLMTGMIYGSIHGIVSLLPYQKFSVKITPKFDHLPQTALTGTISLTFQPGILAWNTLRTYFNLNRRKENS